MRKGQLVWIAGAVAAVWLGAPAGAAHAELRVVESSVPAIAADAVFADSAVFDVAAGQKLKFLKTPGNSTHDIAGPYKGTLDAYQPACGWMEKLKGKCGGQAGDVEGGTRNVKPVMGGTRGLTLPKQQGAQDK
jgi:hypothetical protein